MKIINELREYRKQNRYRRNARKFHKLVYGSSMFFYFISNGISMLGNVRSYRKTYYMYEK